MLPPGHEIVIVFFEHVEPQKRSKNAILALLYSSYKWSYFLSIVKLLLFLEITYDGLTLSFSTSFAIHFKV